jgi:hypothetical protein
VDGVSWIFVCAPYLEIFNFGAPALLSTETVRHEYARTHYGNACELKAEDFSIEDRRLSLDDFSRKQGWMA